MKTNFHQYKDYQKIIRDHLCSFVAEILLDEFLVKSGSTRFD